MTGKSARSDKPVENAFERRNIHRVLAYKLKLTIILRAMKKTGISFVLHCTKKLNTLLS